MLSGQVPEVADQVPWNRHSGHQEQPRLPDLSLPAQADLSGWEPLVFVQRCFFNGIGYAWVMKEDNGIHLLASTYLNKMLMMKTSVAAANVSTRIIFL